MDITNFACFKVNEKEGDNSPDYRISTKIGEEYVDVGAGWIKDGTKGKFISFQLSKPYQDRPGFKLVKIKGEKSDYPTENGDPDAIPF